MGRVRLCIGNYATTPYVIGQTGIRIYSLEELCYYLAENVLLLDTDFVTAELVEWIDVQLGLSELSKSLKVLLQKGSPLYSFVGQILEYGYYKTPEECAEILRVIQENAKLNVYEKKKKRIDYLAEGGHFEQAFTEYQKLLSGIIGKDLSLTGEVYTAMGKIAARMFYFDLAEELFEKAYKITYRRESMLCYVCAVKMHGTIEEQRQKLSVSTELKELEAEADHMLEALTGEWEQSGEAEEIRYLEELGRDGKSTEYYELIERHTDRLKEEYRKHIS